MEDGQLAGILAACLGSAALFMSIIAFPILFHMVDDLQQETIDEASSFKVS